MLLEQFPEFSSGFQGYTGAFCLPMGQGSTRRRDDTMSIGLDFSGIATSMGTHLHDVLGIGLGTQELSAYF